MNNNFMLGILGGLGPYASSWFTQEMLKSFSIVNKSIYDNQYPQFILFNTFLDELDECGLSGDNDENLIQKVDFLTKLNITHFVCPCFSLQKKLEKLFRFIRNVNYIDILKILVEHIYENYDKSADFLVLCSESSNNKKLVYNNRNKFIYPCIQDQKVVNKAIISVMSNQYEEWVFTDVQKMIEKYKCNNVLLCCSELPVFFSKTEFNDLNIIDPFELTISVIIDEYNHRKTDLNK